MGKRESLEKSLQNKKIIAMLAPSFIAEFSYPSIIHQLKKLGFGKVVELTFGAKMINHEYHKILKNSKTLLISSVCPGISKMIKLKFPQYSKNLARIDSPMISTAKICKKIYPKYYICFISPCDFKKVEAKNSNYIDFVINYQELNNLLKKYKVKKNNPSAQFDKFYNEYTRIYPLSGGLSKTAHLKKVLKCGEEKIIDGISDVEKFLKKPDKKIKFLDCTFCKGGCIGGPYLSNKNLSQKKKKILDYICLSKKENIPSDKKGILKKAEGIKFSNYFINLL